MSPPDSVQARPVARPISAVSPFLFRRNFGLPRYDARRSEERRVGKEWRSWRDWSSDVCSSDLSPPDSVQARPVARPISAVSPFLFRRNFGLPRYDARFSAVTVSGVSASLPMIFRAIFRHTDAISRSRLRTPASRVYFSMRP